jgi:hypothetical protein
MFILGRFPIKQKGPRFRGPTCFDFPLRLGGEGDTDEAVTVTLGDAVNERHIKVHLAFLPIVILTEREGELGIFLDDGFLRSAARKRSVRYASCETQPSRQDARPCKPSV